MRDLEPGTLPSGVDEGLVPSPQPTTALAPGRSRASMPARLIRGKVGGVMEGMSTALRAFFTRRLNRTTVYLSAALLGLVMAVVFIGGMIVANQITGL